MSSFPSKRRNSHRYKNKHRNRKHKSCEYVCVKDFGAKGDGIADDTFSIQEALDTENSIFLPNGIYRITSPLMVGTRGQIIKGESRWNTQIKTDTDFDGIEVHEGFVLLESFALIGNAPGNLSTSAGIKIINCTRSLFHHLYISNFGYGLQMFGGPVNWGNVVEHCYLFRNRRAGIYGLGHASRVIGGEVAGSDYGVIQARIMNTGGGYEIDHDFVGVIGQSITIRDMTIEAISRAGITCGIGTSGPNVENCYFEQLPVVYEAGFSQKTNGDPHSTVLTNGSMVGCFISQGVVHSAITVLKAERVATFRLIGNFISGINTTLIDTSESSLACTIENHGNSGFTVYSNSQGTLPGHNLLLSSTTKNGFALKCQLMKSDQTQYQDVFSIDGWSNSGYTTFHNNFVRFLSNPVTFQSGSYLRLNTQNHTTSAGIQSGIGDPNGQVTASVGSMYLRQDGGPGTTLYIKELGTGNTGWAAK